MNFPQELFYTKDHEWISFENQFVLIGITDFAQKELGDIVYLDIPSLNKIILKEGVFGTVEAVKTVSDLFMPVTGKIIEVNPIIDKTPELINQEPYNTWMVKVLLTSDDKGSLLSADEYKELIGK
ncbi:MULTISPECIES: glycine cleavage system protein GcvH [unclassified Mucilaginibacter]|uniref:glycine cleavage system protein GcvH n=1 Tax=unclassified Mucilaginibacter TaxID=2617802 RepID=UPI002AC8C4D3|nr:MULTISPECIES: glycine cleavage system protein GcvH [unclassified Mucilaginibacter]MEB0260036.1 glycine cleavage system protein GcvH [Mucilaginibacter sp. 10I4]MEB0280541.1 glycine cleavage system protein GcvH [Mucilaginibacter sp. 10B2]MEB0301119.1 glycine cleavage system protein GcvH [Mucilaginibacter sp. 5C4]WPX22428.1 glycine cleavage system protein GcvH [Mucilaginibacter sp. 5C4]